VGIVEVITIMSKPAPATLYDFAAYDVESALNQLHSQSKGLSQVEAERRLKRDGFNVLKAEPKTHILIQYLSRFKDPLVVILIVVAGISYLMGELIDASIVLVMVFLSATLNFIQEYKASSAAAKLQKRLSNKSMVWRDGKSVEIASSHICVGDVLSLNAGDLIPADCRIIEAKDCHVNQSALTGESMPVDKTSDPVDSKHSGLNDLTNILFAGTSLVTGTAKAVVLATGSQTEFGKIATDLSSKKEDNDFTQGVKKFSLMILRIIIIFVVIIFMINSLVKGDILQSLAFSVAVAVGLTPEFLPMIMSVTMGKGSLRMAKKGVIVKKLTAIPTLGSMDVLCTDKTGTLTQDKIQLVRCIDVTGADSANVLLHAYLNSSFQTGITNPLDEAVIHHQKLDIKDYKKVDEIPFDFVRKKMSVVVEHKGQDIIITKGAPEEVLKVCSCIEHDNACHPITVAKRLKYVQMYDELSQQGFRVLAVACKLLDTKSKPYTKDDESDLRLLGFVAFLDPAKTDARSALDELEALGIEIKIITGDNELVAAKICADVDVKVKGLLTGSQIDKFSLQQLQKKVEETTIFARVSPDQKNRIIKVLRQNGHVVAYMGDGINDAPSLQSADVGISVANGVDVAKQAADIILTHKNLHLLKEGVKQGRKTFGNTLKYIIMGLSSNFGNMFSVLGAVLFLPFLPMLPVQILLNNFLYDFAQLTIPSDNVDSEYISLPKRWDLNFIKKFMFFLGPISSLFDFLTFGLLYWFFGKSAATFQTGWFMQSLATQTLVIYIIRTKKLPFIQSRPSIYLLFTSILAVAIGWLIPYSGIAEYFKFRPLPPIILILLAAIVLLYLITAEIGKRWFYKHYHYL